MVLVWEGQFVNVFDLEKLSPNVFLTEGVDAMESIFSILFINNWMNRSQVILNDRYSNT